MRQLLLVVCLAVLSACRSAALPYEDSPYSIIPDGSRLILHRDLTVPAARASLYIQGGEVRPYADVNPYHPHCRLELEKVRDTPQRVHADVFAIEQVHYEEIPRAARRSVVPARLLLATDGAVGIEAKDLGRVVGGVGMADGSSPWTYATHLRLRSERQPEVRALRCQHWEDPAFALHLTVRQIRDTLGRLFTLEIRGAGG